MTLLNKLDMPAEPRLIQKLTTLRKQYITTRWRLYDKALSVLSTLKKQYKLALVSDCYVGLSDIIEALQLPSFFDVIILSYEVGITKPDKQIYLLALERLHLQPDACVFISDALSDLEGARTVGLKTIHIRHTEHPTPPVLVGAYKTQDSNFKPDAQCRNLTDCLACLQSL